MKSLITIFLIIIFSNFIYSQQSWNEKMGDHYFASYSFKEAVVKYEFIKEKTTRVNRNLAESYFCLGSYEKSEQYYSLVVNSKEHTDLDLYKYSSVLAINKKYTKAEEWRNKYYVAINQADNITHNSKNTVFYKSLQKNKYEIKIENLDINSKHTDFGVVYFGEEIIYTSSDNGALKKNWKWNNLPYLNLYSASLDNNMQIVNREPFLEFFKAKYHKGPLTINEAGDFMVFTVNSNKKVGKEKLYKLDLYYSTKKNEKWSKPRIASVSSHKYSSAQASLSLDGNMMFFAADIRNDKTKKKDKSKSNIDLYVAFRKGKAKWTKPVNLGEKVNTNGKELFPFYHPDGFLFFASDGKPGLGGLDVFVIKIKDGMPIGEAENLGAPINSNFDDFSFILNKEQKSGFFSSNRPDGKGDDDIYKFTMKKPFAKKIISGIAKDNKNNMLANTEVSIYDDNEQLLKTVVTNETGEYSFSVNKDRSYKLLGNKEKYYEDKNIVNTNVPDDIIISNLVLNLIPNFSLLCIVKEKTDGSFAENIKITLIDNIAKQNDDTLILTSGKYIKSLSNNKLNNNINYNIRVEKEGYITQEINYKQVLNENKQYIVEIEIYKHEVGIDLAKMENISIYFDYEKFDIRQEAEKELGKIVLLMNNNLTMKIELSSHTDCRGSMEYNSRLSDQRAKASADYIKKRITKPERIYGKGYGSKKPVNDCDCNVAPCTETEFQENRRTEFNIINK